jgi:hypothetical protein
MFEGGVLIETTSFETSSPIAMAYAMAKDSHYSNGGNYAMFSR